LLLVPGPTLPELEGVLEPLDMPVVPGAMALPGWFFMPPDLHYLSCGHPSNRRSSSCLPRDLLPLNFRRPYCRPTAPALPYCRARAQNPK
jgi:hypothetical protein